MDTTERFINYTKFDTQSSEDSQTVPSTSKQLVFAKYLREELEHEGFSGVEMDEKDYICATLKANTKKDISTIGSVSHYDTSPDTSGADTRAHIMNSYDGGDIVLSEGIMSPPEKFPELKARVGEDLIVTDGHTLLGADDKAGIAKIVDTVCYLRDHDEIEHGDIHTRFDPDEEIGLGAHHFGTEKFGCSWAYTMDGGDIDDLGYENFNTVSAKITIKGVSIHIGCVKDKMINANRLACEFNTMIPDTDILETTKGYQRFYHLLDMKTRTEEARMSYLIRDHDHEKFEDHKDFMEDYARGMNEKYGEGAIETIVRDQYYSMKERIEPNIHVIDVVLQAMQETGVAPKVEPIRSGADGIQLGFKGLPCPNISADGVSFHSPYEFVSTQVVKETVEVIVKICETTAQYSD